jgi:hypothetical protein
MENNACEILSSKLEEMQTSRKLDDSAIPVIKQAIIENKKREACWLSNKDIPAKVAFVMYHASRNTRIIMEKMLDRFLVAAQIHENPKVVDDAMLVYPELQELCTFMDSSAMSNKFTDPYLEFVKKRVRNLRNTAMRAGMLPTTEEEIKKVDKKELAKQFGAFAEDIRLRLV